MPLFMRAAGMRGQRPGNALAHGEQAVNVVECA
jgi:hypothetical protein